ncbi:hypothetical protein L916_18884 [Phytophthora nicotianae]|uniref:Uncharacterized protein n=1 Tax=Phytophthora nicotianae TaxID=4792 RepID=W2I2I4_PHYNI|nr:hypothetical protein L916_18884 [Phytophthora nicotianae]
MSVYEYAMTLTNYMATLDDLDGLLDDKYLADVREGRAIPTELEIYAASKMHGWGPQFFSRPSGESRATVPPRTSRKGLSRDESAYQRAISILGKAAVKEMGEK